MEEWSNFLQQQLLLVEEEMGKFIQQHTTNQRLKEAMLYSIQAGGKRLRPRLLLATVAAFNKPLETGSYQIASALELVHTYSLIHDDLPAMDDDDLRRGKPTNHKVYGEAHAILAGDGLLTAAFQQVALSRIEPNEKILLLQLLAKASGTEGMVAGQAGDLQGEEGILSVEELAQVHEQKTGALIEFALLAGGVLAQQTVEILTLLGRFAYHLGLAFQIRDDLLDATSSKAELGKNVRRDQALNKSTYPSILGVTGAKAALNEQIDLGNQVLEEVLNNTNDFQPKLLKDILAQLRLS